MSDSRLTALREIIASSDEDATLISGSELFLTDPEIDAEERLSRCDQDADDYFDSLAFGSEWHPEQDLEDLARDAGF